MRIFEEKDKTLKVKMIPTIILLGDSHRNHPEPETGSTRCLSQSDLTSKGWELKMQPPWGGWWMATVQPPDASQLRYEKKLFMSGTRVC